MSAGLNKALGAAAEGAIKAIIRDRRFPTIAGGALRLMREGIEPWKAWNLSRECLIQFLKDEGVKVGHPDYVWDDYGGAEIVEEYEIRHWEARDQ